MFKQFKNSVKRRFDKSSSDGSSSSGSPVAGEDIDPLLLRDRTGTNQPTIYEIGSDDDDDDDVINNAANAEDDQGYAMVKALIEGSRGGSASARKIVYANGHRGRHRHKGGLDSGGMMTESVSSSTTEDYLYDPTVQGNAITAVAVVNFHHYHGPCIEYVYAPELSEDDCTSLVEFSSNAANRIALSGYPSVDSYARINFDKDPASVKTDLASILPWIPMLALPDGAHSNKPDFVYMVLPAHCGELMFGISIFYRVPANQLAHKDKDVTRGYVQKAVVIISKAPFFGNLLQRSDSIVVSYFQQMDFENVAILRAMIEQLNRTTQWQNLGSYELHRGVDVVSLIRNLEEKLWWIVKAVLLERRVIVYSSKARVASSAVLAILACLPPGQNYLGFNSPGFGAQSYTLKRHGLPLCLFNSRCPVYTYVSLELMDDLYQCRGFLIGTSNSLLLSHRSLQADLVVDMDKKSVATNKAAVDSGKELMKFLKLDKDEKKLMRTLLRLADVRVSSRKRKGLRRRHRHKDSASSSVLGSYVHESSRVRDNLTDINLGSDREGPNTESTKAPAIDVCEVPVSLEPPIGVDDEDESSECESDTSDESEDSGGALVSSGGDGAQGASEEVDVASEMSAVTKATDAIIGEMQSYWLGWLQTQAAGLYKMPSSSSSGDKTFADRWRQTNNYAKWRQRQRLSAWKDSVVNTGEANMVASATGEPPQTGGKSGGFRSAKAVLKRQSSSGEGYATWDNGDEYVGQWLHGKRQGRGRYVCPSRNIVYDGNWSNDLRNGWGELVCEDGGYVYDGEWKDDKREGEGRSAHKATGEKYSGHFSNNRYDGNGCLVDKERNVYEGEFKNGMKNGVGRFTDAEGNTYIGEYRNNKRCGNGQLRTATNNPLSRVYVGEFKDDLPNGSGTCVYLDKYEFEGSWVAGQRTGSGTLECTDEGVTIEGEWLNGRCCSGRSGQSVQIKFNKLGYTYAGTLDEQGFAAGHGILKGPQGYMYDGRFSEGLRDGDGMEIKDGVTKNGTWSRGQETEDEKSNGDEDDGVPVVRIPEVVNQLSDLFPPPTPPSSPSEIEEVQQAATQEGSPKAS